MNPLFRITNAIARNLTHIERARGFLDAAKLSEEWLAGIQRRALVLEAHHTTHIEGTHLTLNQSERVLAGEKPAGVGADDAETDRFGSRISRPAALAFIAGLSARSASPHR